MQICAQPSHKVVRCRNDRDRLLCNVEALLKAERKNMRKTLSNVFRWKMTEVEENALVRLQSFVDRPCNNIPRSKFIDESFTCAVDQVGPFTANGFGYQKRRKVWKLSEPSGGIGRIPYRTEALLHDIPAQSRLRLLPEDSSFRDKPVLHHLMR